MQRRDAIKAMPAAALAMSAAATTDVNAQTDARDFTVHSSCAGFYIAQNGENDYSLRMVAADGAGSLKYLRLTGPDALAELSDIFRTLTFLSEKFGVRLQA